MGQTRTAKATIALSRWYELALATHYSPVRLVLPQEVIKTVELWDTALAWYPLRHLVVLPICEYSFRDCGDSGKTRHV